MDSPASNTECQARIEELSRSNDDLTNLLDSTDVAMVLLDAELCVRTFTRKATDIISLTATDTGRPIKHLTTTLIDTDLANFSSLVLRDLTAYEAQVQSIDDQCFFMRIRPGCTVANVTDGVLITFQDITEHKRVEAALRDSEIRSRTLLEGSPVCNKIISLDSRLLYMSAAGIKQLGIPDNQAYYGRPYPPDFYSDAVRAPLVDHLDRALAGEISSVECPLHDTEGREVWYHTTFVPACDDEGRIEYVIATSVNITERKLAEEQLRHTQKMEAIGQLASGVAHEFNNILVGILGNPELLLAESGDDVPERFQGPLRDIKRSGWRAADLTKQLLSFARKKSPAVSLFDVNRVVTDNTKILQQIAGGSVTLKTLLAPDPSLCAPTKLTLNGP